MLIQRLLKVYVASGLKASLNKILLTPRICGPFQNIHISKDLFFLLSPKRVWKDLTTWITRWCLRRCWYCLSFASSWCHPDSVAVVYSIVLCACLFFFNFFFYGRVGFGCFLFCFVFFSTCLFVCVFYFVQCLMCLMLPVTLLLIQFIVFSKLVQKCVYIWVDRI